MISKRYFYITIAAILLMSTAYFAWATISGESLVNVQDSTASGSLISPRRLKDAGNIADAQNNGLIASGSMFYNGATWDKFRGDTTNGVWVNVKSSISPTISGPSGTSIDKSGTITAGGTSQILSAANATRKHFEIQNPPDATGQGIATAENLCFNFTANASATAAVRCLVPGQSYNMDSPNFVSTEVINVWATTINHRWFAREF